MAYSEKVLDHFFNPRGIGTIANADGVGVVGSDSCGDEIRVWIKVQDQRVTEIKYQVFGCPAAIACCSMMVELGTGKTLDEALTITDMQVVEELGGLSEQKVHCSSLAASGLHEAIESYFRKEQALKQTVKITVLVDNSALEGLQSEHGLSFWIEYGDQRILYDTGQSDLIIQNAEDSNIDLSQTDAIVLSHGHYDHTGGLIKILELAPDATIFLHPDAAKVRYNITAGKRPKDISMPKDVCEKIAQHIAAGKVVYTRSTETVIPGVIATGFIPRVTDYEVVSTSFYCDIEGQQKDEIEDDQSLLVATSSGYVLLLGCAHAGVVNILKHAESLIAQPIHTLIGGMHLKSAADERISRTIKEIESRRISIVSPMHCTGQKAIEKMELSLGTSYRKLSAGETICIPPAGSL